MHNEIKHARPNMRFITESSLDNIQCSLIDLDSNIRYRIFGNMISHIVVQLKIIRKCLDNTFMNLDCCSTFVL